MRNLYISSIIYKEDVGMIRRMIRFVKQCYGDRIGSCLLYTSPSPRDRQKSRMPSSA